MTAPRHVMEMRCTDQPKETIFEISPKLPVVNRAARGDVIRVRKENGRDGWKSVTLLNLRRVLPGVSSDPRGSTVHLTDKGDDFVCTVGDLHPAGPPPTSNYVAFTVSFKDHDDRTVEIDPIYMESDEP